MDNSNQTIKAMGNTKIPCQNFYLQYNHYGRKVKKRCKSTATKELNGKQLCINCYNKANNE